MARKAKAKAKATPKNHYCAESRAKKLRSALMENGIYCGELEEFSVVGEIGFITNLYDCEGNEVAFGFDINTGELNHHV